MNFLPKSVRFLGVLFLLVSFAVSPFGQLLPISFSVKIAHAVDTDPPVLVSFTSMTADGTYYSGDVIHIIATFDEPLGADSVMVVDMNTGAEEVSLDQISGSTLSGNYTIGSVGSGQNVSDLDVGSIRNASLYDLSANSESDYNVPSTNISNGSNVSVYTDTPALVSFTSSTPGGTYYVGDVVNITAHFAEPLGAGSTMTVAFTNGATTTATLSTISGSTLSGSYILAEGENDVGVLNVESVSSANIKDISGIVIQKSYDVSAALPLSNSSSISAQTYYPHFVAFPELQNTNLVNITYDHTLDTASVPDVSDFTLLADGTPVAISSISVSGSTVSLNIPSLTNLPTLLLSYNRGVNPLKGLDSHLSVRSFSNQEVTTHYPTLSVPGPNPFYASVVGKKLYFGNLAGTAVSVIDSITDIVTNISGIGSPNFSVAVGKNIYVGKSNDNRVSVIDTVTGTVIANFPIGNEPEFPVAVGTKVYFPNGGTNVDTVAVVDADPAHTGTYNTVIATLHVGGNGPELLTAVGKKVYTHNVYSNTVGVIDTTDDSVTVITGVPGAYASIAVGNNLYVSNYGTNTVTVVDTRTDSILTTISVGTNPEYFSRIGKKVYVNNLDSASVSVIDADPTHTSPLTYNTVIATIPVGNQPKFSHVVGKYVYVNNKAYHTISVIDSDTDTVVRTIVVGDSPAFPANVGNKLYVPNYVDNTISVIDTNLNRIVNVNAPHLLSFTSSSANGNYTTGQTINISAVFNKTLTSTSTMTVILNTGATVVLNSVSGSTLSGTYTIGSGEVSPDLSVTSISSASISDSIGDTETTYYVPDSPELTGDTSRNLSDLKNIVVNGPYAYISVGTNPYQLAPVGTDVYVTNQGSDSVSVVDSATHAVTATIPVGSQPYGVAYNSGSKEVYVANLNGHTVSIIDADSTHTSTYNKVIATTTVGLEPYYVASLGSNIYVTNNVSGTVSVINTATHAVTATVRVGVAPRGIKAHGTDLYVANFGSSYGGNAQGSVSVINSLNNTVTATVDVGSGTRGVAVSGDEVYVANFNDDTVSVVSTATNAVTHTISVGHHPRGMLALGSKIYAENFDGGTISVIDTVTHAVTATVKVGNTPAGLTAVGTDIYISRFTDGTLSVLNSTTNLLRSSFPDTTAPTISSVSAGTPTSSGTTITWTTDESADSLVEYGLTSSYTASSTYSASLDTSHSATLSGLTADTVYHYRVISADGSSNTTSSSDATFTTASASTGGSSGGGSSSGSSVGTGRVILPYSPPIDRVPPRLVIPEGYIRPNLPNLTFNTIGKDVKMLQSFLISGGFLSPSLDTGYFGRLTEQALMKYQKSKNIPATGYFGPATRAAAVTDSAVPPITTPVSVPPITTTLPQLVTSLTARPTDLSIGSRESDVKKLQQYLNLQGFVISQNGPGALGSETDYFGPATQAALIKFQKAHNISPATGYFGPKTRAFIQK